MQSFRCHSGLVAPLPLINIDTDMIIPKQFLKTIKRSGLGKHLFHEMRYAADGTVLPEFILNQPPYKDASILVSGANFGCGSSREHAPWALLDYGFRAIIAPSFADIFYNNCFKNGILPIIMDEKMVQVFMKQAGQHGCHFTIDLEHSTIQDYAGNTLTFAVDSFRRHCLLNGLDDIGLTLVHQDKIAAFEATQRAHQPWLWG
jgi:3-isopropylmalate/(R)-2-methylmalate dehydratase small subunit